MKKFQPFNLLPIMLVAFSISLLSSCQKDISVGTQIKARGEVYDDVKKKPLPNVTLYLYGGYRFFLYPDSYSDGPLDSVISDNNGKFSLNYTTTDTHWDYSLEVGNLGYGGYSYGSRINYVVDYRHPSFIFNRNLDIRNATVYARELNYTKIHLKVLENPYDSFYVSTSAARERFLIIGKIIDTVLMIRHLPNADNSIRYYTQAERDTIGLAVENAQLGNHPHYGTLRRIIDTFTADMADTIIVNKIIPNSSLMPRY